MPPALPWDMPQPEALPDAPAEHPLPINIGRIADQYPRASHGKLGDITYGLKDEDGKFFLHDAEVGIDGNDLIIDDKRYHGTQGLWDLIVMKKTVPNFFTEEDEDNIWKLLTKEMPCMNLINLDDKSIELPTVKN